MIFKNTTIHIILVLLISVSTLALDQETVSREQNYDINLVRRAKGEGHTGSSGTTTTTKNTHGGGNSSAYGSPAILQNGTLFYISLSVTCFLWVTGKTIDVLTERLDKKAQAATYKI